MRPSLSSPAFTLSRLPLSLCLLLRFSRRRFGGDFRHERVEIDGPGHGEIAGAVRMEAVLLADAVGWNRIFGFERTGSRIGCRAIEIDDRVEEPLVLMKVFSALRSSSLAPNWDCRAPV